MKQEHSVDPINRSLDDSVPIAVIYSVQDVSHYTVEIRHNGHNYFLKSGNNPSIFISKTAAKKAALANKAVKGYIALSLTYQEVGEQGKNPLYEFMPTDLHETN